MPRLRRVATIDSELQALLEQAGQNVERVAVLLRDLLTDYPEHAGLVDEVQDCEHRGDRIVRDIIRHISVNDAARLPFEAGDGHALATAIDDIVDYAEETADALGTYGVEAPMEQAVVQS